MITEMPELLEACRLLVQESEKYQSRQETCSCCQRMPADGHRTGEYPDKHGFGPRCAVLLAQDILAKATEVTP